MFGYTILFNGTVAVCVRERGCMIIVIGKPGINVRTS